MLLISFIAFESTFLIDFICPLITVIILNGPTQVYEIFNLYMLAQKEASLKWHFPFFIP